MGIIAIKAILFYVSLFLLPSLSMADTIYEWTDSWGQKQYSKQSVPGSMISELTELPKVQELTEQQKQAAMFMKLQEMRQSDRLREKKKAGEKNLKQQKTAAENYCTQLRTLLINVQHTNAMNFSLLNPYYIPNGLYGFIENDLSRELHKNCQ